jgi:hypothetical protein
VSKGTLLGLWRPQSRLEAFSYLHYLGSEGRACDWRASNGRSAELDAPAIDNSSHCSQQILLPSAVHLEERLTVSQSVPEPASRQSDRYTQFGFFISGRCGPKDQGDHSL